MNDVKAVRIVTVTNPEGLHVRPCDMISKLARQFQSAIEVISGSERADAKSIMSLLTVSATAICGSQVTLEAAGPDAEEALSALAELFTSNFGE